MSQTTTRYEIIQTKPDDIELRYQIKRYFNYVSQESKEIKILKYNWFPHFFTKTKTIYENVLKTDGFETIVKVIENELNRRLDKHIYFFTLDEAKKIVENKITIYKEEQRLQNFVPLIVETYYLN